MLEILDPPRKERPATNPLAWLDAALREQQTFTAVEQFSRWHEQAAPAQEQYYRDLIPITQPQPGEQYAFEVNLDTCSGCKACVIACHHLNGLEEEETWREVGLLVSDAATLPIVQHVTTACHHCVDPGCLRGCPVKAYEKDSVTGIVRHLDDQCIGCQYCVLMCPYEVPKYSEKKGIVRKCDMCRQRLSANEAPACVQACPNQAIRITLVRQDEARRAAAAEAFLPASPSPTLTIPTTRFITQHTSQGDYQAGNAAYDAPSHAHHPLTAMLVLTQLSVGLLCVERINSLAGFNNPSHALSMQFASLVIGIVGAQLAMLHLGRPLGAWRAWMGWRTSWLSREILAFGGYAQCSLLAVGSHYYFGASVWTESATHVALAMGILGVGCSAMIYIATGRPIWNAARTFGRFGLTSAILGMSAAIIFQPISMLWLVIPLLVIAKLRLEAEIFQVQHEMNCREVFRTARLMRGSLRAMWRWRIACGLAGGVVLPALYLALSHSSPAAVALSVVSFVFLLAGEWMERHLFFTASVSPGMPGALQA